MEFYYRNRHRFHTIWILGESQWSKWTIKYGLLLLIVLNVIISLSVVKSNSANIKLKLSVTQMPPSQNWPSLQRLRQCPRVSSSSVCLVVCLLQHYYLWEFWGIVQHNVKHRHTRTSFHHWDMSLASHFKSFRILPNFCHLPFCCSSPSLSEFSYPTR